MLKKGKCVNIGKPCPKAMNREIQEADSLNFVCSVCGQPLVEIEGTDSGKKEKDTNKPNDSRNGGKEGPRKTFLQKYGVAIGIGVGVVAIAGGALAFLGKDSDASEEKEPVQVDYVPQEPELVQTPEVDSKAEQKDETKEVAKEETKEKDKEKTPQEPPQTRPQIETKDLGYAVWTGKMKNGKMHDTQGTLTFKSSHLIDTRDDKQRVANAGDKVIGTFENGHLVQGRWYKSDGNTESIILGSTD